jgi:hypothetical protein
MRRRHITKPLHTHNPVKTIPEDAPSQAVCLPASRKTRAGQARPAPVLLTVKFIPAFTRFWTVVL